MAVAFQKATKKQARARLAIDGPAGSGKTYTALTVARGLGQRVALIDTEHGSASKYASEFDFDTLSMANFHPERYIEAIRAAEAAGYDVVVVDSASHEWNGIGGCLELVDDAARRLQGNSFAAWKDVTPLHNRFIEAIHQSNLHLIATFRSKMEYVQGEKNGRKTVEKVGMAPITREGAEYEFDIVLSLDHEHVGVITKSRAKALADTVHKKPGAELAKSILAWLSDGVAVEPDGAGAAPPLSPKAEANPGAQASAPANGHGETAKMDELYELAANLSEPKNKLQVDALVRRHGFEAIRNRLKAALAPDKRD